MLRRVSLARTDVSEERSFETSILTRATRRNIPEDGILHSHRLGDLKSYTSKNVFKILRKIHYVCSQIQDMWSTILNYMNMFSSRNITAVNVVLYVTYDLRVQYSN
jgi:hypothetical protein